MYNGGKLMIRQQVMSTIGIVCYEKELGSNDRKGCRLNFPLAVWALWSHIKWNHSFYRGQHAGSLEHHPSSNNRFLHRQRIDYNLATDLERLIWVGLAFIFFWPFRLRCKICRGNYRTWRLLTLCNSYERGAQRLAREKMSKLLLNMKCTHCPCDDAC